MNFINDRFMINNEPGIELYQQVAKHLPIIDYHCHLDAKQIYENIAFDNMTELWLAGDHYKWRAMRANGVSEAFITGEATAEQKFQAWAQTVESCFGNPLYHWTHLELNFYFGCDRMLDGNNWREIMDHCNRRLKENDFTPRALISRSGVEVICTTDSPLDTLQYHRLLAEDKSLTFKVLPTFRPDEMFDENPQTYPLFIEKLSALTGKPVTSLTEFDAAIGQRIDFFHQVGCRISDHGLLNIDYVAAEPSQVSALFLRKLAGETLTITENAIISSAMFILLAKHYKKRRWAMQIHFGAIRNNNSKMFDATGINTGFDSINDQVNLASGLNRLLDAMAQQNALPKTILYNLNPVYNDIVATAVANFQSGDDGVKSPVQFGSGWWFNDTRRGMESQLNTLADQGLLMNFVGMLTDSRSLVSYTRHDYFRRILCNLIGGWVARGEVPDNKEVLTRMIKNICHDNAEKYFNF